MCLVDYFADYFFCDKILKNFRVFLYKMMGIDSTWGAVVG